MKKYYGSYAPVRYNKTHKHPNIGLGQKHQTNSYYLNRAYHNGNGTFIKDDIIYIAGTRNMKDVAQWPLIPSGLTHKSDIYRRADQNFKRQSSCEKNRSTFIRRQSSFRITEEISRQKL
jgi:hypothetical protein